MKPIINPIEISLLEKELTPSKLVRQTNFGDNEIYIITHHDSPNVMKEIGRLREHSFREAGGGTGKDLDIDAFDIATIPYQQLIVWSKENKEIIGGYRFIRCKDVDNSNIKNSLATAKLFHLSEKFKTDYLPNTIELGRSFVQPKYQSKRRGIFSLDNLWDGLGALTIMYPETKYFFGKVTMYTSFDPKARDAILYFMHKFFPDHEKLIFPHEPLGYKTDIKDLEGYFSSDTSYKGNHIILNRIVRQHGESIPPLFNAYMNLSSTMKTFGTAINKSFGEVEETGILVHIDDIYPSKKHRHISTFKQ